MEHEQIRAWTIQTSAAWESFQTNGILRGDGRRAYQAYRDAYRWIMGQMMHRLPVYENGWPVWLWMRWNESHHRPDLRYSGHLEAGQHGVRLELEAPRQLILPHDFEQWHYVLHNAYFAETENACEEWERGNRKKSAHRIQTEKEKSWEKIFDVANSTSVAAVIEYIRLDQVRAIHHFIAR